MLYGGALEERWRSLVLAVRAEFWNDGRDPNEEMTSLFPLRLLRASLGRRTYGPEWFERTVSDAELTGTPPDRIARDFYDAYRQARAPSANG